tara:strand:+ start:350 stop:811 length:462 start_codon:yes stop_codon:yes gene_type:complete
MEFLFLKKNLQMNKSFNKLIFLSLLFFNINTSVFSKIIIFSSCFNNKDSFIKNEYILNLDKSTMTRNFIYDNKTYKKYRSTDLSIKKKNSIERFIYKEQDIILTDKVGYPQFYTQILFEKNNPNIRIKTVINNEEAVSNLSTCKKIEIFEEKS